MNKLIEYLTYTIEILSIVGIVVEITPIKISPLKWIAKRFNGDIIKGLDDLNKKVDDNDIDTIRHRIANFENLCRMDKEHNNIKKHQYIAVFKDIDKWNRYHIQYPYLNGELKVAIENIEECYKKANFND